MMSLYITIFFIASRDDTGHCALSDVTAAISDHMKSSLANLSCILVFLRASNQDLGYVLKEVTASLNEELARTRVAEIDC